MLSLFIRKDIARAHALADDLDRYRHQLHLVAELGRDRYGHTLGTPAGLLVCFGAGCLAGLYSKHHPESVKSFIALTKSVL